VLWGRVGRRNYHCSSRHRTLWRLQESGNRRRRWFLLSFLRVARSHSFFCEVRGALLHILGTGLGGVHMGGQHAATARTAGNPRNCTPQYCNKLNASMIKQTSS